MNLTKKQQVIINMMQRYNILKPRVSISDYSHINHIYRISEFKLFFDFLEQKNISALDKFIKEYDGDGNDVGEESGDLLLSAFMWVDSIHGAEFWVDIEQKWQEHYKLNVMNCVSLSSLEI